MSQAPCDLMRERLMASESSAFDADPAIALHLAGCEGCRRLADEIRAMDAATVAHVEQLAAAGADRFDADWARAARAADRRRWGPARIGLAGLALAAVVSLFVRPGLPSDPGPPPEAAPAAAAEAPSPAPRAPRPATPPIAASPVVAVPSPPASVAPPPPAATVVLQVDPEITGFDEIEVDCGAERHTFRFTPGQGGTFRLEASGPCRVRGGGRSAAGVAGAGVTRLVQTDAGLVLTGL